MYFFFTFDSKDVNHKIVKFEFLSSGIVSVIAIGIIIRLLYFFLSVSKCAL